jgi:hypothetical protein
MTTNQEKFEKIKQELLTIGRMRPGSITKQWNVCGTPGCRCKDKQNPQKHGPYNYLSSNYGRKNRTQFVQEEFVPEIKKMTEEYKRFKKLIDTWIKLEIKASDAQLQTMRNEKKKKQKTKTS